MWIMQEAICSQIPRELDVETIYARLMMMNFIGIHTSFFTTMNLLLDSLSRPDVFNVIKKEIGTTYQQNQYQQTKPVVNNLKFIDNILYESMHLSGSIVRLIREVKTKNGIQLNSVSLPKGIKIASNMHNMHRNKDIYQDVNTFNSFRLNPSTGQLMPPAVEMSENFLPFGHG